MAKDPRFNFYPDNYMGGTKRMNFEQKGAYVDLLMLNFYCLNEGLPGFTEQEALHALASAAAPATLFAKLSAKFNLVDGYYCSERLHKEFTKSKNHSKKQSDRAKKRWSEVRDMPRHIPDNRNRIGNGIDNETKGGTGENSQPTEANSAAHTSPSPLGEAGVRDSNAASTAEASAKAYHIGTVNGHRIIIQPKYAGEKPIIIHDLQEYFHSTDQLEALQKAGWNKFKEFMQHNPSAMYNDAGHLYNAYRKFCLEPPPDPHSGKPLTHRERMRLVNKNQHIITSTN